MACVMSPITGQVFSCQIPLPPEHFGLIDNDCVPVTLVEIQDLISLAESQHQWIDLVGHPREEDRSDAKVGMILFTEAHLEYNAGLVISIGSASRPSPITLVRGVSGELEDENWRLSGTTLVRGVSGELEDENWRLVVQL